MQKRQKILSLLLIVLLIISAGWIWLMMRPTQKSATTDRIIATTNAQVQVFNKLDVPLVGVATPGNKQTLPKQYRDLPKVGNHVAPNLEKIGQLKPDLVYLDAAIADNYQQKLDSDNIKHHQLDFNKLTDLQSAITKLGTTYHKESAAKKLNAQLDVPTKHPKNRPNILLLMGMPGGSFLVGTQNSYVGDLINRAGGHVVGSGSSPFVAMNAEQIAQAKPTVIITMAHAMPKNVFKNFDSLFKQANWQSIPAVQEGHVYQANEPTFSMTANLNAPDAYKQIQTWLNK